VPPADPQAVHDLVEFLHAERVQVIWTDGNEGDAAKVCTTKDWPNKGRTIEGVEFGAGLFNEHLKRKNPAAVAKASGLLIIEGDSPEDMARIDGLWLPDTFEVHSGRGGGAGHRYYRPPEGATKHAVSFEGGAVTAHADKYFLLPTSTHKSGNLYTATYRPIATLSQRDYDDLLEMAGESREELRLELKAGKRLVEGEGRWPLLTQLAGSLQRAAASEETILQTLKMYQVDNFADHYPDRELCRLARAAVTEWDSEVERMLAESAPPKATPSGNGLGTGRLSEVEEKPARFFDRPLLQAGTFHVVSGRKGAGKGTYLSELAARVTKGELGDRRSVLWVSSEDSPAMDLKPRLAVASGDLGHVHVVNRGWLQLPRDVEWLREEAERIGDVALVIIDPVGNHITGADSNAETAIRDAIGPLNDLADGLDAVVVGIRHLTEKEVKTELRSAVLGSSAWVQVPRVVVGIVEDDEEDDLRHVRVVIGNRVPKGEDQLAFRIVGVERPPHEMPIPRLEWVGASDKDMDKLLQGQATRSSTAVARDAIIDELSNAPGLRMESNALDRAVIERTGLSAKTLRNLRSKMVKEGLIHNTPEKDAGQFTTWFVCLSLNATRDLVDPDPLSDGWGPESQSSTQVPSSALPTTFRDLEEEPEPRSLDHVCRDLDGGWD
jgi:hypothetical protein